jgi:ribosome biogenesis SPOUT family RNA methylase Rps3
MASQGKTFVVEHLDEELEAWSSLEYSTIASESYASGAKFLLSSVPTTLKLPENLKHAQGLNVETRGIEEIYADRKDRVCLLDPAASKDLSPEDGDTFDIFLFGGILGKRLCCTRHVLEPG